MRRRSWSSILNFYDYEYVIPTEAEIQKNIGFRAKPGMTDSCKLMSLCIFGA
ncbi:MAG: hypothetical protein NG784_12850 [Candidatus Jettenia sp.]|nr:hypothetical protein [Candidatus Jettenia sp.]